MYGFWRLGLSPAPSAGAAWVANGLETATSMNAKNVITPPRIGTAHGRRLARRPPCEEHRDRREAGEDQEPEQQRALLPAPERRDRVPERQLAARVVGDVDEAEIVLDERREQDGRADEGGREGRHDRVLRRLREPLAALPGGNRAGDDGVKGQPEADDERCAPELGH